MPVEAYSTTASLNSSSPPNGWPEGMQPADVNNCGRQVMADVATLVRQLPWLLLSTGRTVVRNSNLQFQITGADDTTVYTVGRRIRSRGGSTVYGVVTSSSFSAGNTTVNVTNDGAANLPSPLTAVDVADTDANVLPLNSAGLFTGSLSGTTAQRQTFFGSTASVVSDGSQTELSIVNGIDGNYAKVAVEFFLKPASDTGFFIRTGSNGVSVEGGASDYAWRAMTISSSVTINSSTADNNMLLIGNNSNSAVIGVSGRILMDQRGSGSLHPMLSWDVAFEEAAGSYDYRKTYGWGSRKALVALTGIQIFSFPAVALSTESYLKIVPVVT